MDAPLVSPQELVRPWRTATLVASLVAALELVLLVAAGVMLVAKPLAHRVQKQAETKAFAPLPKKTRLALPTGIATGLPRLARQETGVWVFNGNGRAGAASSESSKLGSLGYVVAGTGNARRQDYATTMVMYRPGYRVEGTRLAHDLHVKIVGPLDGLPASALGQGQLAVILGAA